MSEADQHVSDATRAAEADDEQQPSGADRPPTPDEAAAAEALPPVDPEVAEAYAEAAKTGAEVQGEGQIER